MTQIELSKGSIDQIRCMSPVWQDKSNNHGFESVFQDILTSGRAHLDIVKLALDVQA